jgi:hypothetical protein
MTLASLAGRNRANGALPASKKRTIVHCAMAAEVNQGVVGDTAKLIVHRLIARQIRRDPALVEKAKIAHARQADQFAGWPFVREWGYYRGLRNPIMAFGLRRERNWGRTFSP